MEQTQKNLPRAAQSLKKVAEQTTVEVPDTQETHDKIDQALGKVTVYYGANRLDLEVAGFSVGQLREKLQIPLNIAPNAEAIIDGEVVNEETIVLAGQTCEFIRQSGVKG